MIPVTIPFLPPKAEYDSILEGIWKRQLLTNMGPIACELEMNLKKYLNVNHLLFVTNGTVAIQLAIKVLNLSGDIITTPFSFVATSSSIVWEGCNPIFVDIDENSLNIDPKKIEAAITKKTTAILATHVYGNPCDVVTIQRIADKHGLKVIYDAAHCFGVNIDGESIFNFGDIATCSLHATKLFHSGEGGLVVTRDPKLLKKVAYARNFGFDGPEKFQGLGINGKNSEFHAAMGLANLKYIDNIYAQRKLLTERYDKKLKTLKAEKPKWHNASAPNYAYYPIVFETETLLLKCMEKLNANEVFGRRYFYPSLAQSLPYLKYVDMPITDSIAKRVFCLPLYYDLTLEEVDLICQLLLEVTINLNLEE